MAKGKLLTPKRHEINSGFCACGCGGKTRIAKIGNAARGQFAGYPVKYIHGHHRRGVKSPKPTGPDAYNWKGGRVATTDGYVMVHAPNHRLANKMGYVLEHRLVWDNIHGLDDGHHVHHIDGNRQNNHISNLVAITPSEHAAHHGHTQTQDKRKRISESVRRSWKSRKSH